MIGKVLLCGLGLACAFAGRSETYWGAAGALTLAQGGGEMRRIGGATVRAGAYLTDFTAVEASVGWHENLAGLGLGVLTHWSGWELYDRFFGFSAFDPFVTAGVKGWLGSTKGEVGPSASLGAFYHLGDRWSVRGEAEATLGLDSSVEMVYTLALGLQYAF